MGKFKIGDRIKIKSWDQLKKEFGECGEFGIPCAFNFTHEMKYLCNEKGIIKNIIEDEIIIIFDTLKCYHCISKDMIKKL